MRRKSKNFFRQWGLNVWIVFLSGLVLVLGVGVKKMTNLLPKASFDQPVQIYVNVNKVLGPLKKPWSNLAQGGEEDPLDFEPVLNHVRILNPEYVRIDHVFDFYKTVSRDASGKLEYDFSRLDKVLGQIDRMGAKPFVSLSYMPDAVTSESVVGLPESWGLWGEMVKSLVEHVSGKGGLGFEDVYYEVWNEPDLFGGYKTYGNKNYLEMYRASSKALENLEDVERFFLGGPATTKLWPGWITELITTAFQEDLRLDFVSWHLYDRNVEEIERELLLVEKIKTQYPQESYGLEWLITEWGLDSEVTEDNDSAMAGAHTVAVARRLINRVEKAFVFEIYDGPDPAGEVYWGRWGLLTHPSRKIEMKPRYLALKMLNGLGEHRVSVGGETRRVKVLAGKSEAEMKQEKEVVNLVMTNYDATDQKVEMVPVTFAGLSGGEYEFEVSYLSTLDNQKFSVATDGAKLRWSFVLAPNDVVSVGFAKVGI